MWTFVCFKAYKMDLKAIFNNIIIKHGILEGEALQFVACGYVQATKELWVLAEKIL